MGVVIPQVVTEDRASEAQFIDGSLRFDASKSHYLTRTPSSAGNRNTWTWSGWFKKNLLDNVTYWSQFFSAGTASDYSLIGGYINNLDDIGYAQYQSGTGTGRVVPSALYRDTSAWYHMVVAYDLTQATAANRIKLYINGTQITALASTTYPNQNAGNSIINNNVAHYINGRFVTYWGSAQYSQFYFIDGQALDASYFGYTDPLTNTWRPKKFGGSYNGGTLLNYNNNTGYPVYSNQGSTQGQLSSNPISNAFDSNASTYCDMTYLNGQWSKLTFGQAITNVTNVTIGYDGEGDIGYNGSITNTTVGYTASRQTITLYSGSPITLTDLYFVTQAGNGVCRLYDITITTSTVSATELTYYGANSFYLPMDGNTPIGQDRSGNNNNWTPVNFGGSNTLEKATGALPILNTDGGGKVARVGVRTDAFASNLVLALPLVGIKSDFSNKINSGTTEKAVTATGNVVSVSTLSNFYGGSFYFDASGDTLTVPAGSDFAYGTGDFCVEMWIYPQAQTSGRIIYSQSVSGTNYFMIYQYPSTNIIEFYSTLSGGGTPISTSSPIPINTWNHLAVTRESGTVRIFINGILLASGTNTTNLTNTTYVPTIGAYTHDTTNSLNGYIQDFRIYKGVAKYTQNFIPASTDPDILPDTSSGVAYSSNVALVPSTDGAVAFDGSGDYLSLASSADFAFGTGDFTIEAFCYKQSGKMFVLFDHLMGIGNFTIFAYADDVIQVYNNQFLSSGANPGNNKWFHLAVVRQSGVLSFYIDGIKAPTTHTFTYNFTTAGVNIGVTQYIEYSTGFVSNLHVVKGTALYTSNFTPPTAPITSVANTKLLCCKSNSSATTFDVSPGTITANGNAVATNFNPFTVNINTQRGQESGYCTLNPLDQAGSNTFSNGNLNTVVAADNNAPPTVVCGSSAVSSGKWYWEVDQIAATTAGGMIGVGDCGVSVSFRSWRSTGGWYYYGNSGQKYNNGSGATYGSSYTTNDTISVVLDMDVGSISFYKNGVNQGVAYNTGLSGKTIVPSLANGTGGGTQSYAANFGQKPFKFPPPTGFQPLALANTPRPSIVRPDQYVGIVTYTGNDTTQNINVGWKPDLIWIKKRSSSSNSNHILVDTVRGASTILSSSGTFAESTFDATWRSNWGDVTSFNRDGFTVADGSSADGNINGLNQTYVAWAWKAGGNSNTYNINDVGYATASAAGLTAGTITPTGASVNTKSGFSIISFTAQSSGSASISHGLGNAPGFIIVKSRDQTYNWLVYHKNLTSNAYYLILNSTAGQDNASNAWNSTSPTSSVFTLGSTYAGSGNTIAYLWAEIPGFSKFGSYTGNGSTDGVTVVTGFRPAVVLMKKTSGISNWFMHDSGRNRYNAMTSILFSNLADQEDNTYGYIDFLSNGFKLRFQNTDYNTGSATYIYAAFAETPSFNLYGGQANAR